MNLDYTEPSFGSTGATGNGIWIASLLFHVGTVTNGALQIALGAGGGIIQTDDLGTTIPTSDIGVSAPIILIPEPATAVLIGLGVLGLAVVGRRTAA